MPDVASNSRVDQKGRYLQVGQKTADSFSGAEVSNSSGHELLQMSLLSKNKEGHAGLSCMHLKA